MRSAERGVVGCFEHLDRLIAAIGAARKAGFRELRVYSPTPRHEIAHALPAPRSPVRLLTFQGALVGLGTAFALTIGSSLVWKLITGGKPVVSIVPFLVPAFELTILFGGLATLFGVLFFGGLPGRRTAAHDPRFSDDRFGLFVQTERRKAIEALLREHGAERVWAVGEERRS